MFNKVICIGDSYTNEHRHYENNNIDFKQLGYEFKSYPQLLGEHYGCDWETFGRPGMPMPYSLQILIDKIDYIQSFDNPLVIYQFGFFDNLILSTSGGDYVEWKDIAAETMGAPSHNNSEVLPKSRYQVINHNQNFFEDIQMSKLEAVGMMTFLEKFGDLTNYHLIEQFLSIAKLLKRSNIDIYGLFFSVLLKFTDTLSPQFSRLPLIKKIRSINSNFPYSIFSVHFTVSEIGTDIVDIVNFSL